jgi:hypothetical protein
LVFSNLKIRHKVWETLFVYIFFTLYPDFFRGNYLIAEALQNINLVIIASPFIGIQVPRP